MGGESVQCRYGGLGAAVSELRRLRVQWPLELANCLISAALSASLIQDHGQQGAN